MSLMLNTVQIAGNLTRDPETKTIANNRVVATFGIAINRRFKGADGEMKEETTFVEIECWGRQAELVGQFLGKGRNCLVEGSLQYHKWTDKNGNNRSQLRVLAQRVHFIGSNIDNKEKSPSDAQVASPRHDYAAPVLQTANYDDDDAPF